MTTIPVITRSAPTAAAQPAMATSIAPDNPGGLPNFSSNVVLINNNVTGNNELWGVRTVLDPNTGNDDINWLRINPTDNTVIKEGVIGDPKFSFYFPSIAVNSSGQVVIGFSGSAAGDPEDLNTFQALTQANARSFTLVLLGDQRSAISLLATANDPLLNAFAYVNQNFFEGDGTTDVTVTLNSEGNTEVTYTGSHAILPSYEFKYGDFLGDPHFGYSGLHGSTVIGQFWSGCGEATAKCIEALPTLSVIGPDVNGADVHYALFFAEVTCNGQTGGQWNELSFIANTSPLLTLKNPTTCSETLSDVGFLLSDLHIPVDFLNFGGEPPPGFPGSNFMLLTGLDGLILMPGEIFSVALPVPEVPEPSTLLLLTTSGAALLVFGSRRRERQRRSVPLVRWSGA